MTNTENYSPDHVAVVATAGLTLSVYRTAEFPDCSLDGITSRVARLTLVGTLDCTVYRSGFVYPAPASMRVVTRATTPPPSPSKSTTPHSASRPPTSPTSVST